MNFHQLTNPNERLTFMRSLSTTFAQNAVEYDDKGTFSFKNIQTLQDSGYTSLTIPKRFGGVELSLEELLKLQEVIAFGDGSTALSIGWHMGIVKNLEEERKWNDSTYEAICAEIMDGALINNAATEPQTGSPTRGGKPTTKAHKTATGWKITGRKTFTTMAPVLNYFVVSASVHDTDQVANFLVPRDALGVEIEDTWDSIAMRGTGSHDLVLQDVELNKDALVEQLTPRQKKAAGWLLHIPACYLGIAKAAKSYAIHFANEYQPNSLTKPIITLPAIKQKIAEIELRIFQSESILYRSAHKWDTSSDEARQNMKTELGTVKLLVTNYAIEIVDLAMRIVGAKSLSKQNPLQRYYRDVRAGLHNPPMDDMVMNTLAESAIDKEL